MKYRNKSDKAKLIVVSMSKRRVQPGEIVSLSVRDINHSGANLRHFEQVIGAKAEKEQRSEPQLKENEAPSPLASDNSDYEQPPEETTKGEGQREEQEVPEGEDLPKEPEAPSEGQEETEVEVEGDGESESNEETTPAEAPSGDEV